MAVPTIRRACAALAVIGASGAFMVGMPALREAAAHRSSVPSQAVLDRALLLCRGAFGYGIGVQCTATVVGEMRGMRDCRLWVVDCARADGCHLMTLVWDPLTDTMSSVTVTPPVSQMSLGAVPRSGQAVSIARRTLHRLGPPPDSAPPTHVSKRHNRWLVRWDSPTRTAVVLLDANEGHVRYAYNRVRVVRPANAGS